MVEVQYNNIENTENIKIDSLVFERPIVTLNTKPISFRFLHIYRNIKVTECVSVCQSVQKDLADH